jgi:SAM-dependent methyltransferase
MSPYWGVLGTIRQGHPLARAQAIGDSRTLVRALFLASGASSGLLRQLGDGPDIDELVRRTGCRRPDRLQAWLGVGVDLGEVRLQGRHYRLRGRRARALGRGDALLEAHYRSMLEYQVGPYTDLEHLLQQEQGQGRDDLHRYAGDIARVSLAAAPFVAAMVRATVRQLAPARALDVGCGTGAYTQVVLESSPQVVVDGVDLAQGVIEDARQRLDRAGFSARSRLYVGDVRDWLRRSADRFDLILLLNNIYYFDRAQRRQLYGELLTVLADGGQLLVVSMTKPGSIAASHLNFMLACQEGTASLPGGDDLVADLVAAGYQILEERRLVPTEPFVGARAGRAP